ATRRSGRYGETRSAATSVPTTRASSPETVASDSVVLNAIQSISRSMTKVPMKAPGGDVGARGGEPARCSGRCSGGCGALGRGRRRPGHAGRGAAERGGRGWVGGATARAPDPGDQYRSTAGGSGVGSTTPAVLSQAFAQEPSS